MISPSFSLFFLAVVFTFQVPGLQGKTKGGSPGEVKSDPTTCHNFTVGTPKERKFYSPNYPNYYTSMTECTLILTAPPENLISVDFRGQEFRLEEDVNCTNDYLEVRDGAYGYSRMIGRYCGHKFPPIIMSSYRYLHLRFHSDETIEYSGFAAQYQFIHSQEKVPERPPCRFEVTGEEARISRADIPSEQKEFTQNHGVPLDCTWVITVRAQWMIYIQFSEFELEQKMDCGVNFLDVFGARTDERQKLQHFCGSVADRFNSPENVVHVRFFAQEGGLKSRFSLNSTAFRNKGDTEVRCAQGEFDCDDGVCLHESLQCNGYSNCKFNWDEEGCAKKNTGPPKFATSHILAIMVIGCLLLAGMCILMLFNCFYKLRKDRREYRERRSLERSLHGSVVSTPSGSRRLGLQGTSISKTRLSRIHSLSEDDGVFCIPDPPPRPNGGILMSPIPSSGSRLTLTRESGVQTPGSSSTCPSDEEGSSLPQFSCGLSESSDERLLILGRGELYIPPTPTPPPPPPPIGNFGRHGSSALNNPGSRRASTTHSTRTLPATMPHYRAEAVIEVSERPRRSHSGMSFSSAPDVIVLH